MSLSKSQLIIYLDEIIDMMKARDIKARAKDSSLSGEDPVIHHLKNIREALGNLNANS